MNSPLHNSWNLTCSFQPLCTNQQNDKSIENQIFFIEKDFHWLISFKTNHSENPISIGNCRWQEIVAETTTWNLLVKLSKRAITITWEEIVAASARERAISATTIDNIGLIIVFVILAHGVGVEWTGNGRGNETERAREEATGENSLPTMAVESTTATDDKRNTTVKVEKTWKRVKFYSSAWRGSEREMVVLKLS